MTQKKRQKMIHFFFAIAPDLVTETTLGESFCPRDSKNVPRNSQAWFGLYASRLQRHTRIGDDVFGGDRRTGLIVMSKEGASGKTTTFTTLLSGMFPPRLRNLLVFKPVLQSLQLFHRLTQFLGAFCDTFLQLRIGFFQATFG